MVLQWGDLMAVDQSLRRLIPEEGFIIFSFDLISGSLKAKAVE